jgi:Ca2+-binding RTX toxin-like protein
MMKHSPHAPKALLIALSGGADYFSVGPTYQSFHVSGLGGNDTIYTSYGNDTVDGGTGNDTIQSDGGNDILMGGAGNDTIYHGMYGSATLSGGDGNDWIVGNSGSDVENGGTGNDTLTGVGRDVLTGDAGSDTFMIGYSGPPTEDIITDFSSVQGDKVDLTLLGYWDNSGFRPLASTDLEIEGDDLVAHTLFGDAVVHGMDQVALVGIAAAIADGMLVLDNGSFYTKG